MRKTELKTWRIDFRKDGIYFMRVLKAENRIDAIKKARDRFNAVDIISTREV